MIEVFSNMDSAVVGFYRSLLEEEGIKTFFRNEFVCGAEVAVPVFYPAICVLEPEDEARAREIIRNVSMPKAAAGPDWQCAACNEAVPGNFDQCWNCSETRPES